MTGADGPPCAWSPLLFQWYSRLKSNIFPWTSDSCVYMYRRLLANNLCMSIYIQPSKAIKNPNSEVHCTRCSVANKNCELWRCNTKHSTLAIVRGTKNAARRVGRTMFSAISPLWLGFSYFLCRCILGPQMLVGFRIMKGKRYENCAGNCGKLRDGEGSCRQSTQCGFSLVADTDSSVYAHPHTPADNTKESDNAQHYNFFRKNI